MTFADLGLVPDIERAAQRRGFSTPMPIQSAAIPAILDGADVLATAHTGSGKTVAYALPLLQRLRNLPLVERGPAAVVLVPTRELAAQVGAVLRGLAQALPWRTRIVAAFGGVSIQPQMMALRGGADIVVATPGRLLDLVEHRALGLSAVRLLVLDEADRLLDAGFADEWNRLQALVPAARQNLLFSATFPPAAEALADSVLQTPRRIAVDTGDAPQPAIVQRAIRVDTGRRTALLRHLIATEGWQRVLVFVATKHSAEHVAEKLYRAGIFATAFHGDLSQGTRTQVLEELRAERWEVVVTTDLAARGIDVAQLPVVVNYDLPRSPVDHVHRIGRTGRAGAAGVAVSFVTPEMEAHFRLIEKRQGLQLEREVVEGFAPRQVAVDAGGGALHTAPGAVGSRGTGGVKGQRPSKKDKLRAAAALAATAGIAPATPSTGDEGNS
ncbi:DEAD/DEAH box helicase [uncultured Xylophilus sp.]|uniref:DEAD/DEAH box helicase n=1 Tax=uncultured Xylophilus sp. TaxID=296832 RepID=UPI0025D57E4E|nr:DEAD/DEAH box helicase [uncultured Xylophilus sp.]